MEGRQVWSAAMFHHLKSFLDGRLSEVDFVKCHAQPPPCLSVPLQSLGVLWSLSWRVEGQLAPRGKTHEEVCWQHRDTPSWSCDYRPAGPSGRRSKGSNRGKAEAGVSVDNHQWPDYNFVFKLHCFRLRAEHESVAKWDKFQRYLNSWLHFTNLLLKKKAALTWPFCVTGMENKICMNHHNFRVWPWSHHRNEISLSDLAFSFYITSWNHYHSKLVVFNCGWDATLGWALQHILT